MAGPLPGGEMWTTPSAPTCTVEPGGQAILVPFTPTVMLPSLDVEMVVLVVLVVRVTVVELAGSKEAAGALLTSGTSIQA